MTAPVLVTGAAGWLGQRLVRALQHGLADVPDLSAPPASELRCLVVDAAQAALLRRDADQARCIVGDVTRPESLVDFFSQCEGGLVFHCAGVIHPRRPREFTTVNTHGTRNVLDAAARAGIRRLIYVSSNSPLGSNPTREQLFDETTPYNPYLGYGRSKRDAEELVIAAGRDGAMQTVIVRPPWFYGPGQPLRQTTFFRMIKRGRLPLVGGGHNLRSMAYVDNICQGLFLSASVPHAAGRIYWIADRRPYPMAEVAATVADVLNADFGIPAARAQMVVPNLVSACAQLADTCLQAIGVYNQQLHVLGEMNKDIACSIAAAERELGYAPRVELREGMRRSIEWLLQQGGTI